MNAIENIERDIRQKLPEARTKLRRPRNPEGEWWLDTKLEQHDVTVQWTPRLGFGISASMLGDGYGEAPEETYSTAKDATHRIIELLSNKGHTTPPTTVLIKELRGLFGVTQQQLASELGVQQAAVSKLERRDDMTLSSLRRLVEALGAKLEINVRTADGEIIRLAKDQKERTSFAICDHVYGKNQTTHNNIINAAHSFEILQHVIGAKSHHLSIKENHCVRFAETDNKAKEISINPSHISKFAHSLYARWRCVKSSVDAKEFTNQVLRQVVSHEIGHCFPELGTRRFDNEELVADEVSGWIARNIGDDEWIGTAVSTALGCSEGDCSHPAPEERSAAFLFGYHRAEPALNLCVVRSSDINKSQAFYSQLGLRFHKERHGIGPEHYACNAHGTVFELYPRRAVDTQTPQRFGFRVPVAELVLRKMLANGWITQMPVARNCDTGSKTFVIQDPDGNKIEVSS